jgi:diphosphomevalonate decarboxylase
LFGGFVRMPAGVAGTRFLAAEPLAPADHWDLRVVVAVASEGPKSVSSTKGMLHTADTSPYYDAWVKLCPVLADRIEQAIVAKDFEALTEASEQSALAMHASALAAAPGVVYFEPVTLAALREVQRLRADGIPVFATMDAGPHVKAVTLPDHVQHVQRALQAVPGVLRTIVSTLGGDASVELVESGT